jgi:AbiV family abortive infection protein
MSPVPCRLEAMAVRRLPDLTPEQVEHLQDALLANADRLLGSAAVLLELGHAALARSLAILGLEESGKAIAIHERRVSMVRVAEGEAFRCDWLDALWASHERKLETVHRFLLEEPYWFDIEPPDPDRNAAYLGSIKSWARRHDRSKQRGFYVDLSRTGDVMAPTHVGDEAALREVIARVHQIGWQLRLGEHIEGKRQDEREAGTPSMTEEDLSWLDAVEASDEEGWKPLGEVKAALKKGIPGEPLANAAYRFNPPGADRTPFRNLGKPGYEAETRELVWLSQELDEPEAE